MEKPLNSYFGFETTSSYRIYDVNTDNVFSSSARDYAEFLFRDYQDVVLFFDTRSANNFSEVLSYQNKPKHYKLKVLTPDTPIAKQLSSTLGYYFPEFKGKEWLLDVFSNWIKTIFGVEVSAGFVIFEGYSPKKIIFYEEEDLIPNYIDILYSLSIDSNNTNVEIPKVTFGIPEILEIIDNYFKSQLFPPGLIFESPRNSCFPAPPPPYKDLEKELHTFDPSTQERLQIIIDNLEELRATGQLFLALPLLDKLLKEQAVREPHLFSPLVITNDYKILLPQFNIEVQLSHLTKAFYILFTQHPWGIRLSELPKCKEELKRLYLYISNQNDYDKMMKSVDDLLNSPTNIATHLSRIKDRFCELLYPEIALHYCVLPDPEDKNVRYIPWYRQNNVAPQAF